MYREDTEALYSLATDLNVLGISWLWDGLEKHVRIQALFDAYDHERTGKIMMRMRRMRMRMSIVRIFGRSIDIYVLQDSIYLYIYIYIYILM